MYILCIQEVEEAGDSAQGLQTAAGRHDQPREDAPGAHVRSDTAIVVLDILTMQLQPGTCPFPVQGFWGELTMLNAGIMACCRDLPSTTRI